LVDVSLRGLIEVASDILHGLYEEISLAFTEAGENDWDEYGTVPTEV
jgi:hypothetical protein